MPDIDDNRHWFPMRVSYGRPERVVGIKESLDGLSVENFLPMTRRMEIENGKKRLRLRPAIDNLIFVRSTRSTITWLKMTRREFLPLRYMMWQSRDDMPDKVIRIPDGQMENFMRVASVQDDRVMFLGNKDFSGKIGKPVRVVDGIFKGVEGTIYRVKKDRRVVITLQGVASVAIACISPDLLKEI